jgi:DnaK suppressor protein
MTTPSEATNADDLRDERSELSERELRELEQLLIAEREAVQRRLRMRFEDAADHPASLADDMDQASKDQDQGLVLRLADKEFKLLREIDHALAKLSAGTFGVCEGTEEPIGYRRLRARPWSRHCLAYQEQREREQLAFEE